MSLTGVSVNANAASSTNTYEGGGGGAYVTKGASLTVTRCMFENNTGYVDGQSHFESSSGGISCWRRGHSRLEELDNFGQHWPTLVRVFAIYGDDVNVEVTSCTISNSKAFATARPFSSRVGAGVFVQTNNNGKVAITGTPDAPTVISGNEAEQGAGGLYVGVGCRRALEYASSRTTKHPWAAVSTLTWTGVATLGALDMSGCKVVGNSAGSGAGIYTNGNLTIKDSTIDKNVAF